MAYMPRLPADNVVQRNFQKVETPCNVREQYLYNFRVEKQIQEEGRSTEANPDDWDEMMSVMEEPAFGNVNGLLQVQTRALVTPHMLPNRCGTAAMTQAQYGRSETHEAVEPERQERQQGYGQLHYDPNRLGVNAHPRTLGQLMQMVQDAEMPRPGTDQLQWFSSNWTGNQSPWVFQDSFCQEGINYQDNCHAAATSQTEHTTYPLKQFPFEISRRGGTWSGCNSDTAGHSMGLVGRDVHTLQEGAASRTDNCHYALQEGAVPWTDNRHYTLQEGAVPWTDNHCYTLSSNASQCMDGQMASEGNCFRLPAIDNLNCLASPPLQNFNAVPAKVNLTYTTPNFVDRALYASLGMNHSGQSTPSMDLLHRQIGASPPNCSDHAVGRMPFSTSSVQHIVTENESPSIDSSPLEQVFSVGSTLPSSSQNMEGLDTHSGTGAGILFNEFPPTCTNETPKKERLTKVKTSARTRKKCKRLTEMLSDLRNPTQADDGNGDLQQKQKRKKIRCRVMKDQRVVRGRGGRKSAKAQENPQATNLHREEEVGTEGGKYAENGVSSVGETMNSPEISPPEEGTSNVSHMGLLMSCIKHRGFFESCNEGSGINRIGMESSQLEQSFNRAVQYGTGFDSEKPHFVDFFALSDQQHHAETKDFAANSSMSHTASLPSFCQQIILYDRQLQHSESNQLSLSLFPGEPSVTGSTDLTAVQGRSKRSASKLPVRRSSNYPSSDKENPDDGLQLVLYNQKRDMVVSRFRAYKKIRAKVLLDQESQRVWLQLENGAAPKVDDDAAKARHWERQRGDMRNKVELFIKKMHEVQGNRKFSPWKGSIVDSVVGAFLTQNVSDHLSSSAFMSVASRFPPLSKQNKLVSCPDMRETFSFKRQSEINPEFPLATRFSFSSAEELDLSKQGNSIDDSGLHIEENMQMECVFAEGPTCLGEGISQTSPCSNNIEGVAQCYTNTLITLGNSETKVASYEEDVSNCGTLDEISGGAFHQPCTIRGGKARRMLKFCKDAIKQQPPSCEAAKQVGLALLQEGLAASDNISDQHSESESGVGSSGSVHSVQDSNFQVSCLVQEATLELDLQANTQASNRELDVAQIGSMPGKKRQMSLSSISGMERAQLEVNQKGRKRNHHGDWESVRKQALGLTSTARDTLDSPEPRSSLHEDSVNWDAVQRADLAELADTIKERGMHHVLSGRIKAFLTSVHEEHGSVDLEWLRNLSSPKAREFLMSIHGLGVKSVECIRLLTLHHLAFPVDTNVGRICVRLGWVPIEPLPEEVQLHLVELYPIQETIQKYLWPRLCTLDQRTLYELHYQLITFGKVFCTKSKPNCNACPMRTECKHFASAYASAKPLLTGPEADQSNRLGSNVPSKGLPMLGMDVGQVGLLEYPREYPLGLWFTPDIPSVSELDVNTELLYTHRPPPHGSSYGEYIVEEPQSPERICDDDTILDLEDMGKPMFYYNNISDYSTDLLRDKSFAHLGNPHQVNTSFLNDVKTADVSSGPAASSTLLSSLFSKDLCYSPHHIDLSPSIPSSQSQSIMSCDSQSERCTYPTDLVVDVASNAIVAVPEAAQIPAPKLKSVGRLRTIHYVYELPDDHSLLKSIEVDAREKDDPCSYLLAIWSPGETPESQLEIDELCGDNSATHTIGQADENVAGTLLIPCRTAMHGSFPLNGTYFQVNEVFADHASSLRPLQVPRSLIWSLRRRFVYFGTSVPNIFKGLSTDEIKDCFWRGHVCVRGFDRRTRAPKPLVCRLHFPISKQPQKASSKGPGRKNEERHGFSSASHA